jgi:phosphoglycerate kinase
MRKMVLSSVPVEELHGHRVLVRVDYNVPIENGTVTDDTRIRATLPTLRHIMSAGARAVLVSHLGRPKGTWRDDMSIAPAAARLGELLDGKVRFVRDIVGVQARAAADALPAGHLLVLENVRFLAGEETNDPELSEALAAFGDIYVNDAFGSAHRAHASTSGVAEVMKQNGRRAVAGLLLERELRFLGDALDNPARPFSAILGGAKISGKLDVIDNLLPRVDRLLIGGAMANTFFRALGLETGTSLVEDERVDMARDVLRRAEDRIVLPVDCVTAGEARAGAKTRLVERTEVPADASILDIGPGSVATFRDFIERSRTVLWNGPMGLFEIDVFAAGTRGIAQAVAAATRAGAVTIVGGGDSVSAVEAAGLTDQITHVSTGGGATLEFLEGRTLPGVAILDDVRT